MLQTLRNAWKIPELRKKVIFTLFILLIYRVGNVIPVPFIDVATLRSYFDQTLSNTILGLYNAMSGSAFSRATVFALGIQPYINASIIIQLLTIAIPALERLAKDEGEDGKKKIARITRYSTVGLGLLMGWAYYMMLRNYSSASFTIIEETGFLPALVIILAFTAGSALVMWLGEQITEFGIGNGISMILFANIVSGLPSMLYNLVQMAWWKIVIVLVGMVALILFIVFINDAERRIPIQYAKRVVGRKVYGGQNTNLPIKVSMSGVMPVIFAQSIASLPATVAQLAGWGGTFWTYVQKTNTWTYVIFYALLIVFFGYFYSTIQFNPIEISNNLRKNGGFIPGYRPGKPTSEYIQKVLNKITLFGSIYLCIIAAVPYIVSIYSDVAQKVGLSLGGTSIIIVVGVALETVQALESQMLMRHYKGFLK